MAKSANPAAYVPDQNHAKSAWYHYSYNYPWTTLAQNASGVVERMEPQMIREFDGDLSLLSADAGGKKKPTPTKEWRCEVGWLVPDALMGSFSNPLHGCVITYDAAVFPGSTQRNRSGHTGCGIFSTGGAHTGVDIQGD